MGLGIEIGFAVAKNIYEKDYKETIIALLKDIFKSKYGTVAIERGKILGYLSFGGINGQF